MRLAWKLVGKWNMATGSHLQHCFTWWKPTWSDCKHATFLILGMDGSWNTTRSLDTGEWIGLNVDRTALVISIASTNTENVPLVSLSAVRGDEGSTCHTRPWHHNVSNRLTLVSHFSSGDVISPLNHSHSIPQRYSCVKGASPWDSLWQVIRIFRSWRPSEVSAVKTVKVQLLILGNTRFHTRQHLRHGLSAKNPMTVSWHRWVSEGRCCAGPVTHEQTGWGCGGSGQLWLQPWDCTAKNPEINE